MYVIYEIKNTVNDKVYIGSTKNLQKRMWRHFNDLKNNSHHCLYLQRFVNKYNIDTLSFNTLHYFDNADSCHAKEFELLNSMTNLFNTSKQASGGDLISYHPLKEEIVLKMKLSLQQRCHDPLHRLKYAKYGSDNPNWRGGNSCSDCGISISRQNMRCMKCSKAGINNPFAGKSHSDETIEKLRLANLGKKPINSCVVIIDNIEYLSAADAAKAIECSTATILNRCKSLKFPNYIKKV